MFVEILIELEDNSGEFYDELDETEMKLTYGILILKIRTDSVYQNPI